MHMPAICTTLQRRLGTLCGLGATCAQAVISGAEREQASTILSGRRWELPELEHGLGWVGVFMWCVCESGWVITQRLGVRALSRNGALQS